MNIAIITTSLGKGGAERVAAIQSEIFTLLGHDVIVIAINNSIDYQIKGKYYCLENQKRCNKPYGYRLKKALRARGILIENKIELIVDHRPRNHFFRDFIFNKWVFSDCKKIFMIHSFNLTMYLTNNRLLRFMLYAKNDIFIAVSEGIKENINNKFRYSKTETIYNTVNQFFPPKEKIQLPNKYILFAGRIDDASKNFMLLFKSFKKSKLINNNIKLLIIGKGNDVELVKKYIKDLELTKEVVFYTFCENLYSFYSNAIITIMTSRFEGLPMVLLESLSMGTPVISVDCKSGPSEIIKDGINGKLVENYNIKALAEALNIIIDSPEEIEKWKANSIISIENFSKKQVTKQWKELLSII